MRLRRLAGVFSAGIVLLMLMPFGGITFTASGPWTGIISPARATDWSATGATISSPNQCGSQLASSSTAAQINTAITNCSSTGGVVSLAAGTFNLSGAINMKSRVVLRGQGMATILNFTDNSGSNWYWASDGTLTFQGSVGGTADNVPPIASAPAGTDRTWTGTNGQSGVYTQSATVINLGSTPTGLSVGDTIILWQSNVPSASLPIPGFFFSAKTGTSNAISWQGSYNDHGGSMEQRSTVTAINGTAVTIDPGLAHPTGTWTTAQSPHARWFTVSQTIHDAGVENLRLVSTSMGAHQCDICIAFAKNVWVKGVGLVPRFTSFHAGGAVDYGILINDSHHVTIANNWINTMRGGGINTTTSYGVALVEAHHSRVENNIFNNVESPTELLIGSLANVVAYNYERYVGDDSQEGGIQQHEVASAMNLAEGNSYRKVFADEFHGNTGLNTYFRNHFFGGGFDLWSYHRWFNLIGNVINSATAYQSLATDATKRDRFSSVAFRLGYPQQNASSATTSGVALDPVVWTSLFRWGNYSVFGNATHFDASEVPTADPVFPNPVPSTQTLPASFYLTARPNWWPASKPWPAIGPDVTGGNISGYAGHANTTPAQDCYTAVGGTIANFNAATCYPLSGGSAPGAPTNLTIVP